MDNSMNWWMWLCVGMGLFCLELFIPTGLYLLVIGLAFGIVGALTWLGLLNTLNMQLAAAGLLLVVLMPTIRGPLSKILSSVTKSTGSDITAQRVKILSTIPLGEEGKGELTGAVWKVRNDSEGPLLEGNEYAVAQVDGLTLIVRNSSKM